MLSESVEWPTVAVAAVDVVGITALVIWGDRLPWPVVVLVLALLAASFNSVQHEIIHGHPTPVRRLNDLLGSVPIGVVYPYEHYRASHLAHHDDDVLTLPGTDPESFYVTAADWERYSSVRRAVLLSMQTLPGRMLFGPPVYTLTFWPSLLVRSRTDPDARRMMVTHLLRVGVLLSLVWVAPIPLWTYLAGAVWLGWSISLIRSFVEHRAVAHGSRSAVVRSGRFWSLLFLNNNLHVTHHARPGLAWYRLPEAFERSNHAVVAAGGAGFYESYGEIMVAHLFRPIWHPVHPEDGSPRRITSSVQS